MTNPVPKSTLERTEAMQKDKAYLTLASKIKLRWGRGEVSVQSPEVLCIWGKQVSRQLSDSSTAKSRRFVSII